MSLRVIGALCLAGVLALSHWVAFVAGSGRVQARWDREVAVMTKTALQAEKHARMQEQAMVAQVVVVAQKVSDEQKLRARDAQSAAGELRSLKATLAHAGACDSTAAPGVDGGGTSGLLLACAAEHQAMAAEADTVAVRLGGLQSYVAQVCK